MPARYGDGAVPRLLVARAEALGGGAYGMEALNVLRIEKGLHHPCRDPRPHHRLRHRHGADDRAKKDCIGKAMAARPGCWRDRASSWSACGPVAAEARLTAGAHLFAEGAEAVRANDQGYVTSVCHSPTLGDMRSALGFLKDGRARHGRAGADGRSPARASRRSARSATPVQLRPRGRAVAWLI